jgi:DsbC/DsbD-like thiol-disulfide interchange protein
MAALPVMERNGFLIMRQFPLVMMTVFLMAGAAAAQRPSVVEARMLLATDAAPVGSTAKAAVVAEITPGYHINDNKPTLDYLIPTELKLEPSKEVSVTKVVYPKGELKSFAFSDAKLSVYEGTLELGALLEIGRTARPGTYTLKGKFAYQACNDHACLPPTSVPVTLAVKVVPRGAPVKRVNGDVFDRISFE